MLNIGRGNNLQFFLFLIIFELWGGGIKPSRI